MSRSTLPSWVLRRRRRLDQRRQPGHRVPDTDLQTTAVRAG
ncbi:hypothetical protein [Geodermatophilus sp. DSM 45219]|nr:hypothetical protein [Geodermatophilus sp. DSM 45219]